MSKRSERRRQKKLARKKAKRKAKRKAERSQNTPGIPGMNGPVYKCYLQNITDGMVTVMLLRKTPHGSLLMGTVNLDLYCLGVKNAFLGEATLFELNRRIDGQGFEEYDPAKAKKLILDSVEYAENLGFKPHPDFRKAFKVFNNIDSEGITHEFEFGCKGKPLFISGPYDNPSKCRKIMEQLKRKCGEGNFDFIAASGENIDSIFEE